MQDAAEAVRPAPDRINRQSFRLPMMEAVGRPAQPWPERESHAEPAHRPDPRGMRPVAVTQIVAGYQERPRRRFDPAPQVRDAYIPAQHFISVDQRDMRGARRSRQLQQLVAMRHFIPRCLRVIRCGVHNDKPPVFLLILNRPQNIRAVVRRAVEPDDYPIAPLQRHAHGQAENPGLISRRHDSDEIH